MYDRKNKTMLRLKNKKRNRTRNFTRKINARTRNLTQKLKANTRKLTRNLKNISIGLTLELKHKRGGKKIKNNTQRKYKVKKMRGGNCLSPLIGTPYNAASEQPAGNFYAYNQKVEAWPQQSNAIFDMKGGKKKRGKKQKGGGFLSTLLPDEIVNIGRSIPATLGQMYDRFDGSISPASTHVYPTDQPLAVSSTQRSLIGPPGFYAMPQTDLLKMYNNNNNIVSRI